MPLPVRRLKEIEKWRLFLKEYGRLESELIRITDYIPLANRLTAPNFRFGSPKAAAFGLDCCTWIETCLRNLITNSKFDGNPVVVSARNKKHDMDLYRRVFEGVLRLSQEERTTKDALLTVTPFKSFTSGANPGWFKDYSKFKHDRVELASKWSLGHSVESLAALSIVLWAFIQPGMVLSFQSDVFLWLQYPTELATMSELVQ